MSSKIERCPSCGMLKIERCPDCGMLLHANHRCRLPRLLATIGVALTSAESEYVRYLARAARNSGGCPCIEHECCSDSVPQQMLLEVVGFDDWQLRESRTRRAGGPA